MLLDTPPPDKDFLRFCRKNLEKLNIWRGMGGEKMTYAEFENLLLRADRLTAICNPKKAEYWRGYRSGIEFHFQNGRQESLPDHYSIIETARRNGSHDVHAYARGYRDGCKGLKPEDAG
jgi:hypothetical protein